VKLPPRVTDVCLVTQDFETSKAFYIEKLGFTLSSEMPGFADFRAGDLMLAIWEAERIHAVTGADALVGQSQGHQVMVAVELESPSEIDRVFDDLGERGIEFYGPPKDYPWNARCIYFAGPSGELWEYFAWLAGGKPGEVE
jgi:hypothetical protein